MMLLAVIILYILGGVAMKIILDFAETTRAKVTIVLFWPISILVLMMMFLWKSIRK